MPPLYEDTLVSCHTTASYFESSVAYKQSQTLKNTRRFFGGKLLLPIAHREDILHILTHSKDFFRQILTKLLPCAKHSHGVALTASFLHNVALGCTGLVPRDSSAAGFSVQLCPCFGFSIPFRAAFFSRPTSPAQVPVWFSRDLGPANPIAVDLESLSLASGFGPPQWSTDPQHPPYLTLSLHLFTCLRRISVEMEDIFLPPLCRVQVRKRAWTTRKTTGYRHQPGTISLPLLFWHM